jgi:hypothetical protein
MTTALGADMGLHRLRSLLKEGARYIKRRILQAKRRAAHRCEADAPYRGGRSSRRPSSKRSGFAGSTRQSARARPCIVSTFCVSPAIANAIDDAVGVRLMGMPLNPETVYRVRRAKQGRPLPDASWCGSLGGSNASHEPLLVSHVGCHGRLWRTLLPLRCRIEYNRVRALQASMVAAPATGGRAELKTWARSRSLVMR